MNASRPWLTPAVLLVVAVAAAASGALAGGAGGADGSGWLDVAAWAEWSRVRPTLHALFTCHFVHHGAAHAAWNGLALLLTGLVAERAGPSARRALALATLLALPLIPLSVAALAPELHTYRGASGLASAWFVVALLATWRTRGDGRSRAVVALALLLFAAKLTGELAFEVHWFVDDAAAGFTSVPLAHAVGALAGVVACGCAGASPVAPGERAPRGGVAQRPADSRTRRSKTSVRSMRASSVSSTVQKSGSATPSTTLRPSTVTTSGCFGS